LNNNIHLKIENVSKRFGNVQALKGVSLDIVRGSFTTFLGPSGCGKTTMLRTVAGFYRVDGGRVLLSNRVINDVPSHQRNAIMVFQDYALFPHMNIKENIAYGLKIKKLKSYEIEEKIEKTVKLLGIEGLENRNPGQISGGQQQRVALARALVMEPEVLLLDEPLSNLDAKLRMNIRAELRQLQKRLGITTIYVTHDQAEALALSDRIAVMNNGEIIQIGSPWEIYYKPATVFVADFVGTANMLQACIVNTIKDDGVIEVEVSGVKLRVREDNKNLSEKDNIILCIRPETIEILDSSRSEKGENTISGKILNYIFEGASVRYWLETSIGTLIADDFDPSERGIYREEVLLRFHPKKIHILRDK